MYDRLRSRSSMVTWDSRPVTNAPRDLSPFFQPQSIAIVGASDRTVHSRTVIANLKESFSGNVYPINPGRDEVAGLKCYPSIRDLPEVPDLAMVLVGRDAVLSVIRECGDVGVRAAIINADGFAESTLPDGRELQAELVRVARQSGVLVLGPNGLGLEDLLNGTLVFAAPITEPIKQGSLAVISQSGGNCCAFAESAIDRGLGLSHLVSTGNEADVSLSDVIDYLIDDPGVSSFCLYIEAIRDPEAFLRAVERARDAGKPVIAIKVGKSEQGRQAAMAHTGAITGSEVAIDALFERAGVERASTIDDALDLASVVSQVPRDLWPKGPRTVIFTMGGGAASIIADESAGTSLQVSPLPDALKAELSLGIPEGITVKNPIDVPGVHFGRNPTIVIDFMRKAFANGYDAAIVAMPLQGVLPLLKDLKGVQDEFGKPFVLGTPSRARATEEIRSFVEATGIPIVQGLREPLRALDVAWNFQRRASRTSTAVEASPKELAQLRAEVAAAQFAGDEALGQAIAERLLTAYGVSFPGSAIVGSADEAVTTATNFGGPAAIKSAASDIHHKTEAGGVKLGIEGDAAVIEAFTEITAATAGHPDGDKVLVQQMIPTGLELIIGVSNNDEGYPPLIVAGLGGIYVELLRDSAARIAPVSVDAARDMLLSLRGADLLNGFRGEVARDIDAAARAVSGVSRLAADFADLIAAIDINPLIVGAEGRGAPAVDALMILAQPTASHS